MVNQAIFVRHIIIYIHINVVPRKTIEGIKNLVEKKTTNKVRVHIIYNCI